MKAITILILSFTFALTVFSQEIGFGKYRLCYDMYWRCHFQNLIELKTDSTYEFIYRDDTQMKKTQGKWKIDSNFVVLTPNIIPDSIQIIDIFESSNKKYKDNIISISENFNGIPDLEITGYINGNRNVYKTDSMGKFNYEGESIDSLFFSIKGRELKVIPKKNDTPSIVRITIDSNYKDLVYQQLGINKIMIHNGQMLVKYRDSENGEFKTEYFEKIE